MSETSAPTIDGLTAPEQRPCTRCDGEQHLISEMRGMGKYRCDTCEMVVGFDRHADAPEFLLDRGLPRRYSKDVFGDRLQRSERRLEAEHVGAESADV
jgi:hypothetical protein